MEQAQEVSPVLQALYRQQSEEAERLAADRTSLDVFEAAALGRTETLARLLSEDPSVAGHWAPDGFTALHLAAFFGHGEAIRLLLAAGADPDAQARNGTGLRPLHSVVAGPEPLLAEALLGAGANPNPQQQGGWTALHSAAKHGNEPLVSMLLEAGADPSIQAEDGSTAAAMARSQGHEALARLLEGRR